MYCHSLMVSIAIQSAPFDPIALYWKIPIRSKLHGRVEREQEEEKLERGEVATMLMCGHNTPDIVDFLGQFVFDPFS